MTTVLVTNISPEQTREEINRFFSFCGKTQSIDIEEGETLTAKVTYETSQAFKTALLLNNSQFGATRITVADASGRSIEDTSEDVHHDTNTSAHDSDEISQEDKPRSRILAEYLAHGYVVGDAAVTRALELDEKHGVSARFLGTLQRLDSKYRASDKARAAATTTGQQTSGLWGGLSSYFEKASNTATGQRLCSFTQLAQDRSLMCTTRLSAWLSSRRRRLAAVLSRPLVLSVCLASTSRPSRLMPRPQLKHRQPAPQLAQPARRPFRRRPISLRRSHCLMPSYSKEFD